MSESESESGSESESYQTCSYCFKSIDGKFCKTSCHHSFHLYCLQDKLTCPLCYRPHIYITRVINSMFECEFRTMLIKLKDNTLTEREFNNLYYNFSEFMYNYDAKYGLSGVMESNLRSIQGILRKPFDHLNHFLG